MEASDLPGLGLLRQRCDSVRSDIWLMWVESWREPDEAGGSEAKLPGGQIIANDRRFNFSSSLAEAGAGAEAEAETEAEAEAEAYF